MCVWFSVMFDVWFFELLVWLMMLIVWFCIFVSVVVIWLRINLFCGVSVVLLVLNLIVWFVSVWLSMFCLDVDMCSLFLIVYVGFSVFVMLFVSCWCCVLLCILFFILICVLLIFNWFLLICLSCVLSSFCMFVF